MSSGITETDSMMSVKELPWHGLGTVVDHKVTKTEEAIKLAGLEWEVTKQPIYTQLTSEGENTDELVTTVLPITDKVALVRKDTNEVLGVHGMNYTPLQNSEAFKFFDPFLHEGDCFITTAGSLKGGRMVWVLAEIEGAGKAEVIEGDVIKQHLLLATSHDGSLATTVKFVNTRVVCANTLRTSLAERGAFKKVRHTTQGNLQLSDIQRSIDIYKRSFDEKLDIYRTMAATQQTEEEFVQYLERLFAPQLRAIAQRTDNEPQLTDLRSAKKILEAYESCPDLQVDGVRGTVWAGYNAVSHFCSWEKSKDLDNRTKSLWFGPDAAFLHRAEQLALV